MKPEERQLIERTAKGDSAALMALRRMHGGVIFRYSRQWYRTFGEDTCESLILEAVWRTASRFEFSRGNGFTAYMAWYIKAVFMEANRQRKRHSKIAFAEYRPEMAASESETLRSPFERVEAYGSDDHEEALSAIAQLPDRERRILERRLRNETLSKIGRDERITKQRVSQLENKAKKLLARELGAPA